tara:strand:+ start:207 stop:1142 length:936 start_codon:yes stop_codon:yes gene_type:complete
VAKLTRKRTILLKKETSSGSDASPTGSANAILVKNLEVTPIESDEVSRDLIRAYLGNSDILLANQKVSVSFTVELQGSGTAGTAVQWGPALEACGLVHTDASTTNTYAPTSDPSAMSSVSIYCNYDGTNHAIIGARGTFSISCEVGAIPEVNFTLTGKFAQPATVSLPTCTYQKQATPLIFNKSNVTSYEIFSSSLPLQSYSFDMNNEVVYRELVAGTQEVLITNRAPGGSITIENPALSSKNFFSIATGSATGTNKLIYGTAAGNKIEISCPQTDISAPSYSDSDGIQTLDLPYVALPNSGNDELEIKFV